MEADLAKLLPSCMLPQYDAGQTAPPSDSLSSTASGKGGDSVDHDLEVLTDASKLLNCALGYILEHADKSTNVEAIGRRIRVVAGKLLGIRDRYEVAVSGLKVTEEQVQKMRKEIRKLKQKRGDEPEAGETSVPPVMKWDAAAFRWTSPGSESDNMREQALDLSLGATVTPSPVVTTSNQTGIRVQSIPMMPFSINPNRNVIDKVVAAATRKQILEGEEESATDSGSAISSDEETEPCDDQVELEMDTSPGSQSEGETGNSSESECEDPEEPDTSYIPSISIRRLMSTSKRPATRSSAGSALPPRVTLTLETKLSGDGDHTKVIQKKSSSAHRRNKKNPTPGRKVTSASRQNTSPSTTPHQKPFHCPICQKGFNQKHGLKGHMELHNPNRERSIQCPSCPKTFFHPNHLRTHLVSHRERQVLCTICKMTFKSSYALKHHMPVHSENRPFPCDQCDMAFKRRPDLKDHQRVHTDERPFVCDRCHATFKRDSALRNHLVTHDGVKRYKCKGCKSAFFAKGNLKRHILTCAASQR